MKKILIIDDEKPTREFIRHMLDSFKLNVEIYTDGENVETAINAIEKIDYIDDIRLMFYLYLLLN